VDIIRAFASTGEVDLLIVDSIAAMTPRVEFEGEGEDILKETMGLQARLLGKALRILSGPIARSGMTVILINQLRANLGIMYGPKDVSPGGKAVKFFASIRLQVRKGDKIMEGTGSKEEQVGNVISVTAVKNKVAMPFRNREITLYYRKGIDLSTDLRDTAIDLGVITKSGNTYSFGDQKVGVGIEQVRKNLETDEVLIGKVRQAVDTLL
jgi:recombination protein RecA